MDACIVSYNRFLFPYLSHTKGSIIFVFIYEHVSDCTHVCVSVRIYIHACIDICVHVYRCVSIVLHLACFT